MLLALSLASMLAAAPAGASDRPAPDRPAPDRPAPGTSVLVIAHRGASGYRPEHTLEAYRLAAEQGADVIEPDLVITRDGVLVARHDAELSLSTDVAERPAFADRRATRRIDGQEVAGWFVDDFSLDELRTLRARERLPRLRPASAAFDGRFAVPTFAEVLALADSLGRARGRPVGVYPELKHPTYFAARGLPMEAPLLADLARAGLLRATDPVWIQSFEVGILERLRPQTSLRLVLLAYPGAQPPDVAAAGGAETYEDLLSPEGLARVATFADALGVHTSLVLPLGPDGAPGQPTSLVAHARALGLEVHVWTLRAENAYLPAPFRHPGGGPEAHGDLAGWARALVAAGVTGIFTDHPDLVARALAR
ncbi:MAG: glycerophosphodiester phosphodiesterase family protein [Rubricoccaceae bacterium]